MITNINKPELEKKMQAVALRDHEGFTLKDADIALKTFEIAVKELVGEGCNIHLQNFMDIKVVDVPERTNRNPATGEMLDYVTPAHKTVRIKIGKGLKEAVK